MRTRARTIGCVLSCLALATGLAACGSGSQSDSSGTTITVSHGYTDVEAKALKVQEAEWNKAHPDTKVRFVFNGGNDSALQKTVAGFTAGNYSDVSYQYGSSAATLAKQPKLIDLTDQVSEKSFDWQDFYPSEQQAATVGDKVVGVPALVDNLSLVYNKELFRKAGVAPPNASWTWEDFAVRGRQAHRPLDQDLRMGLRQRRERGHRLAVPRPAVAGGR